ncbi:sporulation initiation factor Spo0A C-terminal domain-containing protein [Fredinandcohnia sp. 179-A 10B2 NHS]|uniref:sporulation initiation factor Spo0A C-terminal domain-containing protein n=1 Tax=Fredinandcohnia sp. 179-A 10B2 NHS TaxID=3235176 RepID=UPI0039A3D17F
MNINFETKEKLEKTIERLQKAFEYNDEEYISELVEDLAEFAFFAGYKEAELKKNNSHDKKTNGIKFSTLSSDTIEAQVSKLLFNFGIPTHIKGYRYLIDAITQTYKEPTLISRITEELYPYIAKKYNTTASRVDRAIRHTIDSAWSRGNLEMLSLIRGNHLNTSNAKPTNSEYIQLLADFIHKKNNIGQVTLNRSIETQQSDNMISQTPSNEDACLSSSGFSKETSNIRSKADKKLGTDEVITKEITETLLQLDFNESMSHFPLLRELIYLSIKNPKIINDEIELQNQLATRFNITKKRVSRITQDALSMRFPVLKQTLQYQGSNPMKLSVFSELVIKKFNLN